MGTIITRIIFVCLFFSGSLLGQSNFNFYRMDVSDGLSHNNIYALYQDSNGYIWIGTGAGLHRYDGHSFIDYFHEYGSKNSVGSGYIRAVMEDFEGNLWIGTEGGGLSCLKNRKFSTILASDSNGLNHNNIEHIIQMPDSSLYIATWGGGINVYKDGKFSYLTTRNSGLSNNNIMDLLYDETTGTLWIGTWDGGLCKMINGEITCAANDPSGFNSSRARTLVKTSDGAIWIGTWGEGLFRYKDGRFEQFDVRSNDQETLGDNKILSLASHDNKLWIGTFGGGVSLFENGVFTTFKHSSDNPNSLSSNFIESTLIDNTGSLWAGTFGGGLTKFEESHFQTFQYHTNDSSALSNDFVRTIIPYDEETMLVATRGNGIDLFVDNKFTPLHEIYGPEFRFSTIFSLLKTTRGEYWFGGTSEVGLYVLKNGKLQDHTTRYGVDLSEFNINQIIESPDGSIWLGAEFEGGLNQIKDDNIIRYRHNPLDANSVGDNNVISLQFSRDSTLWVGLRRFGLNTFKNGVFTRYRSDPSDSTSLSNGFVYSIFESSDGSMWIGTEKGLNKFDRETQKFTRFFVDDGLANDMVVSITEDDQKNLWFGTHKGITKYDPNTGQFWNFDEKNGISTYPFNFNVVSKSPTTGELFFGGVNGLLRFHPDSVKTFDQKPSVQITNFRVNNQELEIGPESILKLPIEQTEEVVLNRDHRFLSFEFSAMDFVFSNENQFRYILEGFERFWQSSGSNRYVTYSNLPPGDYVFKVMSSIDGTNWSDPKSLKVKVLPAWWETLWFRILMIILIALCILVGVRWRHRYLEDQKRKLQKLVNRKTEQIQHTLDELKNTQEKLIKSEKLAALSQVVFNLLHELNSPLGSTKAGLEFIKKDVLLEIDSLPKIIERLSESEFHIFRQFVEDILKQEKYYSPEEERLLSQELEKELLEMGISDRRILESLTAIDCFVIDDPARILLKFENAVNLLELAESIILKYHNLRNMDKSVERSINILNSLKTYTLQETEQDFQPLNLLDSIEHTLKLREHVFKRGIEVNKRYDSSPSINGSNEQLHQVWLNLISNANYAMSYKGILCISVKSDDNFAYVSFEDSGSGIPEELREKIFEPFYTTKPLGEGRGIGLDIVKKIVDGHQGTITLTSQPGKTIFTVTLPIIPAGKQAAPKNEKTNIGG